MTEDTVVEWILGQLMADASIGVITQGRIYMGHISTIVEAEYPCITVSRFTPGMADRVGVLDYDLLVQTFSSVSAEQAYDLQARTKNVLTGRAAQAPGTHWAIDAVTTPILSVDTDRVVTYGYTVVYTIRQCE